MKKRLKVVKNKMAFEDPRDRSTRFKKPSELDSYNKFVDKIGMSIQGAMTSPGIGRLLGAAPAAFKRNKKPVFKTGTKEEVKGLTQKRAGGGEVFDMTTEMEVNE